eukprot:9201729-Pyramimonas_sp.AAC.1
MRQPTPQPKRPAPLATIFYPSSAAGVAARCRCRQSCGGLCTESSRPLPKKQAQERESRAAL